MTENLLEKLLEHNNWANLQIIQACSALSDEQLDAEPQSATKGSIRRTLLHLVNSQRGYLAFLTQPLEARLQAAPAIADLQESARMSGNGLLALGRDEPVDERADRVGERLVDLPDLPGLLSRLPWDAKRPEM